MDCLVTQLYGGFPTQSVRGWAHTRMSHYFLIRKLNSLESLRLQMGHP